MYLNKLLPSLSVIVTVILSWWTITDVGWALIRDRVNDSISSCSSSSMIFTEYHWVLSSTNVRVLDGPVTSKSGKYYKNVTSNSHMVKLLPWFSMADPLNTTTSTATGTATSCDRLTDTSTLPPPSGTVVVRPLSNPTVTVAADTIGNMETLLEQYLSQLNPGHNRLCDL